MGNHRGFNMEGVYMFGALEFKRLKVAALNLFHPTASPLFPKGVFSLCDTVSGGWGYIVVIVPA